uniref:Uncharacterized protein n=1 Tax=Solanum lycopersicum TaxID=4081 RepID=A0A3Q7GQI8_SOLLC
MQVEGKGKVVVDTSHDKRHYYTQEVKKKGYIIMTPNDLFSLGVSNMKIFSCCKFKGRIEVMTFEGLMLPGDKGIDFIIVFLYTNDFIYTSSSVTLVDEFKSQMMNKFEMSGMSAATPTNVGENFEINDAVKMDDSRSIIRLVYASTFNGSFWGSKISLAPYCWNYELWDLTPKNFQFEIMWINKLELKEANYNNLTLSTSEVNRLPSHMVETNSVGMYAPLIQMGSEPQYSKAIHLFFLNMINLTYQIE